MRKHDLTVKPDTRLIAKRVSERPKPRPDKPRQWRGIDMTEVMTDSGWAYVVIVLDWDTKKMVGRYSGKQARTAHRFRWKKSITEIMLHIKTLLD